ncbi:MAG TPA: VOC family protein [Dongiaceae bacterium]|jgi:catechol 2,3-dioxygenase-like lactoylglutathione lyase family enzyme
MNLRAHLHAIHLGSPDPQALATFYAELFGGSVTAFDGGSMYQGPDRCLLFSKGEPRSLIAAHYAAEDASALALVHERLARSGTKAEAAPAPLFESDGIGFLDPDGNRMAFGVIRTRSHRAEHDPLPTRLQHVVVGSTDAARLVEFYCTVGFAVSDQVSDDEGTLRACFLRSDAEHHSFAIFQTPRNRLDHHCYELKDWNGIRDWGDRLAARRIPVKWGPGRHGPGNNLFLFFHDPDGNWVEVSAELEVVGENHPAGQWAHEERTLNSWGTAFLRS